jgi:head-tail adaptor
MAKVGFVSAGKLQTPVTIQQPAKVGNIQKWATWQDGVRAFIDPLSGVEFASGLQDPNKVIHDVRIWFRPGVRPKMRLTFNDAGTTRTLEIISALDIESRHIQLQLLASEVVV